MIISIKTISISFLLIMFVSAELNKSNDDSTKPLKRGKRYLDFIDKSRLFFRVNGKDNIIKVNQLWAHAYGYRANYPIENDKAHRPFRRDVYHAMQDLMDQHGYHGKSCVSKSLCESIQREDAEEQGGMLSKLYKLVFTIPKNSIHHYDDFKNIDCNEAHLCPLTLANISPYTDDL